MSEVEVLNNDWSTEKTLADLSAFIKKQSGLSGKHLNDLIKALKTSSASADTVTAANQRQTSEIDKSRQEVKEFGDELDAAAKKTNKYSKYLQGAVSFGLGAAEAALGAVVIQTAALAKMTLDVERAGVGRMLYAQTSGAGSSIEALGKIAKDIHTPLSSLLDIMKESGSAMGTFGLGKFKAGVNTIYDDLKHLGITSEDTASYLAGYLDQQRKVGILDTMDRNLAIQSGKNLYRQTIQMANAMKMSREEIEAGQKAVTEDVDYQFLMMQLFGKDEKLGAKVQEQFMKLGGPDSDLAKNMVEAVSNLVFKGSALASDNMQNMAAGGAAPMMLALEEYANDIAAGRDGFDDFVNTFKGLSGDLQQMDIVGIINNSEVKSAIMKWAQLAGVYDKTLQAVPVDGTTTAVFGIEEKLNILTSEWQNIAATSVTNAKILEAINNTLDSASLTLIKIADNLEAVVTKALSIISGTLNTFADGIDAFFGAGGGFWSGMSAMTQSVAGDVSDLFTDWVDSVFKNSDPTKDKLSARQKTGLVGVLLAGGLVLKRGVQSMWKSAFSSGAAGTAAGAGSKMMPRLLSVLGKLAIPLTVLTTGYQLGTSSAGKYVNEDMPKWLGGDNAEAYSTQILDLIEYMRIGSLHDKSRSSVGQPAPASNSRVTTENATAEETARKKAAEEAAAKPSPTVQKEVSNKPEAQTKKDVETALYTTNKLLKRIADNTKGINGDAWAS